MCGLLCGYEVCGSMWKVEQSNFFLIKINPLRAVENVPWRLKYPRDGRRWKEAIYTSRK
jgi:hypothetical protein